jgi:hypothetical protein
MRWTFFSDGGLLAAVRDVIFFQKSSVKCDGVVAAIFETSNPISRFTGTRFALLSRYQGHDLQTLLATGVGAGGAKRGGDLQ